MDAIAACRAAAAALRAVPADQPRRTLVGFDGFIDHIIDVVDTRESPEQYAAMPTIAALGARISAAAGRSTNLELVVRQTKIGGNGPIMAAAMLGYGQQLRYVGNIGPGEGPTGCDPVFGSLAAGAVDVVGLGPAASTDALEFSDGKVMLGKVTPLAAITYDSLVEKVGRERLIAWLGSSDGVATVNWTMTLSMTDIWRRVREEILPALGGRRLFWFVDLADPAKRTRADLLAALEELRALQEHVDVVLGLNGSEAAQVAEVLGGGWIGDGESTASAAQVAADVRERLGLHTVMVHLVASAAMADASGAYQADGFICREPLITTGAGDHFNAGFFAAMLDGLSPTDRLVVGGATSGVYVRTGRSPERAAVADFLERWSGE